LGFVLRVYGGYVTLIWVTLKFRRVKYVLGSFSPVETALDVMNHVCSHCSVCTEQYYTAVYRLFPVATQREECHCLNWSF